MLALKVTQEERNKYLKRLECTIPLVIHPTCYPIEFQLNLVESEINLEYEPKPIQNIELDKKYKIVAGFEKIDLQDFINFDWLMGGSKIPDLFNKRLVDKMQKICPNDFIALPVTLMNLSNKIEPYENKDFYIINALNTIDALDRKKSTIYFSVEKRVYKKDPWQGHHMAFESNINQIIKQI